MSSESAKINCAACWMVRRIGDELQYLLIRRCGKLLPGNWQPATGKVEKGEKVWVGALREGFEETGIYPQSFYSADRLETFYMHEIDKIIFTPNFVAFCEGSEKVRLAPLEHDAYEWLSYLLRRKTPFLQGGDVRRKISQEIHRYFVKCLVVFSSFS